MKFLSLLFLSVLSTVASADQYKCNFSYGDSTTELTVKNDGTNSVAKLDEFHTAIVHISESSTSPLMKGKYLIGAYVGTSSTVTNEDPYMIGSASKGESVFVLAGNTSLSQDQNSQKYWMYLFCSLIQ